MPESKWVAGYEGLYSVDTSGRVYSHKNNRYMSGGTLAYGHKVVCLRRDGMQKMFSVHRLVAAAFIPNPDNLPIVHHIDGNPQNNAVNNLQWCTQKENVHHCRLSGKFGKMNRKK